MKMEISNELTSIKVKKLQETLGSIKNRYLPSVAELWQLVLSIDGLIITDESIWVKIEDLLLQKGIEVGIEKVERILGILKELAEHMENSLDIEEIKGRLEEELSVSYKKNILELQNRASRA